MHLSPLLLAALGLAGVFAGRLVFGRWFNHLALYSFIWGAGLALFEMRLIDYRPLTVEIWMIVGYAWLAFCVGSITLVLARIAAGALPDSTAPIKPVRELALENRLLMFSIMVLSTVALAAVLQHWSVLINRFGGISGVLLNGNRIYHMRNANQIPGLIPYVDAFSLTAAFLAGIYGARTGRIGLLALFPLMVVVLEDIGLVGRAKMLNAGILFSSAYFLAKIGHATKKTRQFIKKGRRLLMLTLLVAVFFAATEFVRTSRGAFESFYGTSRELSNFERNAVITPSLYMYLSVHIGVFNAYWKADKEHSFPGSNTFAPLFRILARFDIADDVPYFQKFYNIPLSANTGTYLRELHADFGIIGILIVPYLLGFFCTFLWLRIKHRARLTSIALLTHLYVIVAFSFLYQVTRLGYWAVSLIAALFVSSLIDYRCAITPAGRKQNGS